MSSLFSPMRTRRRMVRFEVGGGVASPPKNIVTEASDPLITESGDNLTTEN